MPSHRCVEILPRSGLQAGVAFFSDPLPSDATLFAEVLSSEQPQLFCHRQQTDQIMVLRGSVTLQEHESTWVRIPAGVPHGASNRSAARQ